MEYFWIYLISSLICALIAQYISKEKNRSEGEGFAWGFFFNVLGIIIVGLLPSKERSNHSIKKEKTKEEIQKEVEKRAEIAEKRIRGQKTIKQNYKLLIVVVILFFILSIIMMIVKTSKETESEDVVTNTYFKKNAEC